MPSSPPQTYDGNRLGAQQREYDNDSPPAFKFSNRLVTASRCRNDQRIHKKINMDQREVETVLIEIGETFWLIPAYYHE